MPGKSKLKAIIVDDEFPARLLLKGLAADYCDIMEIVGEAKNGKEAIKLINELLPDLVFLDINLPGLNGFELLSVIIHQPFIIFTTAYEEYASKAFETDTIDYLIKPIEEKRFAQCMQKLQRFDISNVYVDIPQLQNRFSDLLQIKKPSAIPIKTGNKFMLLRFEDVAFLEAKDKYVYVVTMNTKEHLSDTRLLEFEETLPVNFLRVHKSFILNKDHISGIRKHFGNRLVITMNDKDQTKITTGITYINKIRINLGL